MFKLTVTSAVSPTATFGVFTVVEIYGPDSAVLVAVGISVGVAGVDDVGVVGIGVGVVDDPITFNSGLNKPSLLLSFLKVVVLNRALYLNSQPANVAPTILGRSEKCKCGVSVSTLPRHTGCCAEAFAMTANL